MSLRPSNHSWILNLLDFVVFGKLLPCAVADLLDLNANTKNPAISISGDSLACRRIDERKFATCDVIKKCQRPSRDGRRKSGA